MGLPIGPMLQIGMTAISTFAAIGANNANAKAEAEAANQQMEFLAKDVSRQKREAGQSYTEAVSDRVMQANIEIANAELSAMERGVSGSTRQGIIRHLASVEGIDLGRLETSYQSQVSALDSQLEAGAASTANRINQATNQARTQNTSAILGGIGSGLQIYSGHQYNQAQLEVLRNRT